MSKNKRQLRAEAVERLEKLRRTEYSWDDVIEAMLAERDPRYTIVSQLIDLLADDEQPEQIVIEEPDTIRNEFEDNGLLVDDEAEQDSRDKLEADMRQILHSAYMLAWMHGNENRRGNSFEKLHREFYNLLDRQAAITEREFIHSHPVCGGSDMCHATNLLNSESVERETPQTAENVASKDEIRDFDVWSVAYEIYCAGGYVDNGEEPNPPTDGIRDLLARQAAITERQQREWWGDVVAELIAERDKLRKKCDEHDEVERDWERKFNEAMGKEYSMRKELIAELDELRAGEWAKADNAIRELSEENDKLRVERDELRVAFNAVYDALNVPTDWKPIFSAGAATGEIDGLQRSAGRMHSKLARIKEVLDEWQTW